MVTSGIYKIKDTTNNKIYIGQTTRTIEKRLKEHHNNLKNKKHINSHMQASFDKHGEGAFLFEVVEYVENMDYLDEREVYWIDYYNSTDNKYGFNKDSGGNLNKVFSEETKRKLSIAHKGLLAGEKHPRGMRGKTQSEEAKKKISEANKGKISSEETRMKISKSQKGKKLSENHIAKLSIAKIGKIPWNKDTKGKQIAWNKGKKISEEERKRLSQIVKTKPVIQFSKDGILIKKFNSAAEAMTQTGIHRMNISNVCSKNRKTAGGYIWEFYSQLDYFNREVK